MEKQIDISELEDIKVLVNSFYNKVQQDAILANIFNGIIQDNWSKHLEKMYRFWETLLVRDHTYNGSQFAPHANLPVNEVHFDRWKKLFKEMVDENFTGNTADEAKWHAEKMAEMFQMKIKHYQNNQTKTTYIMNSTKYQLAIASVFIWIGFICAISFMEAWIKFQALGITLSLGLGIGRLVFQALNKVEIILSIIIIVSMLFSGFNHFKWKHLYFAIPLIILLE